VCAQTAPPRDGIQELLRQVQVAAQAGNGEGYLQLLASSADQKRAADFARTEILLGATRTVIQERDRTDLGGARPESRFRVLVDVFTEFGDRARVATWRLDVEQSDGDWRIADETRLTAVENLFRLSLSTNRQFDAHGLTISAEDLDVSLDSGSAFIVDTAVGVTGLVLLGRGDMRFHPRPDTEKGQMRIFCGQNALVTRFDAAFFRLNPFDFDRLVASGKLTARTVDPREFRKADEVFRDDAPKSYHLGLGDLSPEAWSLLPPVEDLVAEIHTRRFGTLTYARSQSEPEDITLFDRKQHKNIALYASTEKLERRGPFFNEDDLSDYDVLDYNIDVAVSPDRQWIDGVTRVLMRVKAPAVNTVTLRLADPLVVRSIVSDRFGRLFGFRVKNTGAIAINFPAALARDTLTTLTIVYAGRLESQSADRETVAVGRASPMGADTQDAPSDAPMGAEPSYLYSNRSAWYPQSTVTDYATATIKISLPTAYDCVASGELEPGWPQVIGSKDDQSERKVYWFSASQPLRYFAFIVSRFVVSDALTVVFPPSQTEGRDRSPGVYYDTLRIAVDANPRQTKAGRALIEQAADIAAFYRSLIGDSPFPTFTIALVESDLPGGHSPGYFAALNQPLPNTSLVWRNDPTAFEKYPDFFLAHEFAHQWWGQTVGWRNYHEQWLSEGFAQYFAALYAQHERGDDVFDAVLKRMRKSALEDSEQGPVYLGYRLGQIQSDSRIFRALVYNKGAIVLHMLRRLMGDEAFFGGLRRFYASSRFRKVGTDDFRRAMEAEAHRPLDRFFDRWVYGSTIPRIKLGFAGTDGGVAIHLEQMGDLFDVPVTVSIDYGEKKHRDVVVPLTERRADINVPLDGALRNVDITVDDGALLTIAK